MIKQLIILLLSFMLLIGCNHQQLEEISKERAEDITIQFLRGLFPAENVDIEVINSTREANYWKVNTLINSEGGGDVFTLEVNTKSGKPEYLTSADSNERIHVGQLVSMRK